MQLKYVDTKEEIIAINRKSKHIEPHLHNALEIVCVTSGALELRSEERRVGKECRL